MCSMRTALLGLAVAGVMLAGCGEQTVSAGHNRPATARYTEDQVIHALGLHWTDGRLSAEDDAQECVASAVFTRAADMEPYIQAGDAVATNPSGTAGVKVGTYEGTDEQTCFDRFQKQLRKLR